MPKSWKIVHASSTNRYEVHLNEDNNLSKLKRSFRSRDEAEREVTAWKEAPIEIEPDSD